MKMYFLLENGDFPACHISELRGVGFLVFIFLAGQ